MLDGTGFYPGSCWLTIGRLLTQEAEELNLNILLEQLQSIFWRFLSPAEADSLHRDLEQEVWSAMSSPFRR